MQFRGTRWQTVNDTSRQDFSASSYRVLLALARQRMIEFVPEGSFDDETRSSQDYDPILSFLLECGTTKLSID